MNIKEVRESRERCAESGWFAYDYLLDSVVDRDFILSLRPLGGMTYLPMLKKPFFKVESDYFFIKGMEGDDHIRVAIHDKHREELKKVEGFINGESEHGSSDSVQ